MRRPEEAGTAGGSHGPRSRVDAAEGRPAGGSIRLERDPRWRGPRLDEREAVRLALLREEPPPRADDDRVDLEDQLIDEVALEEPAEELAAAMDLELAAGLLLEVAHGGLHVG